MAVPLTPDAHTAALRRLNAAYQQSLRYADDVRLLYRQLQRAIYQSLLGLANALEAKDPYTRGHSERVGLVAVRPVAKRHLALPPVSRDGSDALVGRSALVTREVTATDGLVNLSGEDWSARPYDEDLVIPPGVRVDVLQIEGATALVLPREPLPDPRPREG